MTATDFDAVAPICFNFRPTHTMPTYNFVNYLWDDAKAASLDPVTA